MFLCVFCFRFFVFVMFYVFVLYLYNKRYIFKYVVLDHMLSKLSLNSISLYLKE